MDLGHRCEGCGEQVVAPGGRTLVGYFGGCVELDGGALVRVVWACDACRPADERFDSGGWTERLMWVRHKVRERMAR